MKTSRGRRVINYIHKLFTKARCSVSQKSNTKRSFLWVREEVEVFEGCSSICPKNLSRSRYTKRLLDCVDDTPLQRNVLLKVEDGQGWRGVHREVVVLKVDQALAIFWLPRSP